MSVILESKQVSKHFGGLKAVEGVDMQIQEGEIFGIIGPNGAGKTTFFNLCAGTFPVTSGEIWFQGSNITNYSPVKVSRLGIARTFQNIQLFKSMSVLENVMVGFHIHTSTGLFGAIFHSAAYRRDEKLAREKSLALLEHLGLLEYQDVLAKNLAYGIQRKVEIARALALSPKLLLLDEPAAGMNPSETQSLSDFIRQVNGDGVTIAVIEHDMKFVMNLCDRVLVLDHGQKLCEGEPEYVSHNQAVIEAYFGKGFSDLTGEGKEETGNA